MSIRSRVRVAPCVPALAFLLVAGCGVDDHDTATGKSKEAAETRGPTDPGKVNPGGPGLEGRGGR